MMYGVLLDEKPTPATPERKGEVNARKGQQAHRPGQA